jgi:hypothetical protein
MVRKIRCYMFMHQVHPDNRFLAWMNKNINRQYLSVRANILITNKKCHPTLYDLLDDLKKGGLQYIGATKH